MDGAGHASDQDEQDPSGKHHHHDQLKSGPFSASLSWNDFWMEIAHFLPPLQLWKLSQVSKSLFYLVWNLLIPNSGHGLNPLAEGNGCLEKPPRYGLNFPKIVRVKSISQYLSRIPSLQHLNLRYLEGLSVFKILTAITNLSCLALPSTGSVELPFQSFSHLTNLTGLSGIPQSVDQVQTLFNHFHNLKYLRIDQPLKGIFPYLNKLTALEELCIKGKRGGPIPHLTRLRYLSLELYDERNADVGWEHLTNLTQVFIFPSGMHSIEKILNLTNLTELGLRLCKAEYFPLVTKMTNLKSLLFSVEDGITDAVKETIPNFTILQNLKYVRLDPELLTPQTVPCLDFIETIDLENSNIAGDTLAAFGTANFSKLKKFRFCLNQCEDNPELLTFLHAMPNLTYLGIYVTDNVSTLHFKVLTRLESLDLTTFKWPKEVDYHAFSTSITSLTLWAHIDGVINEYLENFTILTGLRNLILENTDLNAQGIQAIGKLTNLQFLTLQNSNFFRKLGRKEKVEEEFEVGGKEQEQREIEEPSNDWNVLSPLYKLTRLEKLHVSRRVVKKFWLDFYEYHRNLKSEK